MEEKKRSNTWLIVLLVLIILGLIGYICYDKFYVKENTPVVNNNESKTISITSKEAFDFINKKVKEADDKYPWYITSAEVISKVTSASNPTYIVSYTDYHEDGYDESNLLVVFEYKNNKWEFEIPGSSGDVEDDSIQTVSIKSEQYVDLYNELAKVLLENMAKKANVDWEPINVKVTEKGNNNYYIIKYDEKSKDGSVQADLMNITHFDGKKWIFESNVGSSGLNEEIYNKYNFKELG